MQILVLYFSKGGNTRKLAEMIAQGVQQVEGVGVLMRRTDEVTQEDFLSSAGVIAGSPVYYGGMAAGLKKVFEDFVGIRKNMEGKVGAAFATSGEASGGKEMTMMSIIGDPISATGHYGVACVHAPDDKTCENAAKLGRRVGDLAKKLQA